MGRCLVRTVVAAGPRGPALHLQCVVRPGHVPHLEARRARKPSSQHGWALDEGVGLEYGCPTWSILDGWNVDGRDVGA